MLLRLPKKRLDVTAAPGEGETNDGSDKLQDKIVKSPRDETEKENSTMGTPHSSIKPES